MDDHDAPIWFLAKGGIPTRSTSKKVPADVAWYCREGGPWLPIADLAGARKATDVSRTVRDATATAGAGETA